MALIVRLACQAVVGYEAPPQSDAEQFDNVAWGIAQGGDYATLEGLRSSRAPGFPFLLAATYAIFGHSWTLARLVQAIVGAASCALLVGLGSRLYDSTTGLVAGMLYAVFPYSVFWTTALLSEPLCTLLALVATWTLLRASRLEWRWMAAWSVACALTALTRPNMGLIFLLGLPAVLGRRPGRLSRGLFVTAIFLLTLLPWTARNYLVHHRLVPITTMGGRVLWEGNNPYIAASETDRGSSANAPDLPEARLVEGLSESDADVFYFHLAVDWVRHHPAQALSLVAHKALRLCNPFPNLPSRLQRWAATLSTIVMLILFLSGLILGLRKRDRRLLPLLVPIAAVTMTGLIYWADARIRAPAEPEIMFIAATALAHAGRLTRTSAAGSRAPVWPLNAGR